MNRIVMIAGAVAVLAFAGNAEAAGSAAAGKAKAETCAMCHGDNFAGSGSVPGLAGKSEGEIVAALQDFKSGKRANPQMKAFASKLSDQDMADLGAYFASLKK